MGIQRVPLAVVTGALVGSNITTLTNTSDTTIAVIKDWGTETITFTNPGVPVTLMVWLVGGMNDAAATNSLKFGNGRIASAFDGATFTDGDPSGLLGVNGGSAPAFRRTGSLAAVLRRTGTPTGNVVVKGRLNHVSGGANGDLSFEAGVLMAQLFYA